MKLTAVLLTVATAVFLQVVLARYGAGGTWAFDLVLVGVVYAALQWGAPAGIVAGTLGGLLQDLMAGVVVGVGGLAKTVVGFVAGLAGAQLLLTRPQARMTVMAAATVFHRLMVNALDGLIAQQWPALSWSAMLTEVVINAACLFAVFQATSLLPGVIERQRLSRRSSLSRRQW